MAIHWLRLWHEMPNDPKWKTIARVSQQPITAVISVFVHVLVIASNANERGRTQGVCSEDIASALDLDSDQVDSILAAMQGRVLNGDVVSGWAKRQVEREDGSAERAKAWREAKKAEKQSVANAAERKETPDSDSDSDSEKEVNRKPSRASGDAPARAARPAMPKSLTDSFTRFWSAYPRKVAKVKAEKAWKKLNPDDALLTTILSAVEAAKAGNEWRKNGGEYIPHPDAWLSGHRWQDELRPAEYAADELAVMVTYNEILTAADWPPAVLAPYSPERAAAIREFQTFRAKPDLVRVYFGWLRDNLPAKSGCGFEWSIKHDTFLRAREGNFAALNAA